MELIDIRNQLCLEDYYRTDTHWKQEYIVNAAPLIFIENPKADTDKELIIFRDSFGSSIAPLLLSGYKKVTLVDTRYIQSQAIGNFIEFKDQTVLFLYSTLILNNSMVFK